MTEAQQPGFREQADRLWSWIHGFNAVHCVNAGIKLDLFRTLAAAPDGLTSRALAATLDLHPPYVDVWCKTALHYGVLAADPSGRYRLAPHMDTLLAQRGHPLNYEALVEFHTDFLADDFRRMPRAFRTGEVYPFQDRGPDFTRNVAEQTGGMHLLFPTVVLPELPAVHGRFRRGVRVLDMGCGAGGLMVSLARAFPASTFVGCDIDRHGVEAAREAIAAAGVADRVQVVATDGRDIAFEDEFDFALLFLTLHEIPAAAQPAVLANCRRALRPGGRLLILDETFPSALEDLQRPEAAMPVHFEWTEFLWGNHTLTREEQDALFAASGFSSVERVPVLNGAFEVILADG